MTVNGNPLENAIAERVNGILKNEYLKHYTTINTEQAKKHVAMAVTLYNEQRPHFSIGLLTPELVHSQSLHPEKLL